MQENKNSEVALIDFRKLPAYKGAKIKLNELISENPFIKIEDSESLEIAKQRRTALRKGRTELQNGEKLIASRISKFRKEVKAETEKLIKITQPYEDKQQEEIDRWEAERLKKKEEDERKEQERIDNIKNAISDFRNDIKSQLAKSNVDNIDNIKLIIERKEFQCEEFQEDLLIVKEQLVELVEEKASQLKEAARVKAESEKLKNERVKIELEKNRFLELKAMAYIYEGDDLAEITKEEYLKVFQKAKNEYDDREKKRKEREQIELEKQKLGETRKRTLQKVKCEVDQNTCANMSKEVWEEFYKSKRFAYEVEQIRAKKENEKKEKEEEEELKRRIKALVDLGFFYNSNKLCLEFGKINISQNDIKNIEKENFNNNYLLEFASVYKKEFNRLESLKPDKERFKGLIKSLPELISLKLNNSNLQVLHDEFLKEYQKLSETYLQKIENLK